MSLFSLAHLILAVTFHFLMIKIIKKLTMDVKSKMCLKCGINCVVVFLFRNDLINVAS